MDALDRHAEVVKLARLLGSQPEALAFLESARSGSLREFRRAASHSLFDDGREVFLRLAKLSRLLPMPWLARFTAALVGPELAARVASEMEPQRAAQLSAVLETEFLAEVCLHLEAGRSRAVIQGISADRVRQVGLCLLERREFVCMACFVDILHEPVLRQMIDAIESEADLLRVGFFVEDKAQLNMLISLFDDQRLARLIEAAHRERLWPEAIALMSHVSGQSSTRLGDIAAAQPEAVLTGLLQVAEREGLLPLLLGVVGRMSEPAQRRVAALPALRHRALLEALVSAGIATQRWEVLVPLLGWLPADLKQRAVAAALDQQVCMAQVALLAAARADVSQPLLRILADLGDDLMARVASSGCAEDWLALSQTETGHEVLAQLGREPR